jgi:multidrug resistance efflux pump
MAGSVSAVNVAVGDHVQAGQVLVSLAGSEKLAAAVESARFELLSAQQALADLNKDMDVQQAQADLATAQAQLAAAESALKDLELRAPFDGTITSLDIQVNEWVNPGQPVLVISDLDHLRVETTDLSERDVPQIQLGQPVTVKVEALALDISGSVILIAPLVGILGGDVVYKTTIQLEAPPPDLRAGMSVEVQFSSQLNP